MMYARKVLQDAIDRIDRDECSELAVSSMLEAVNAESMGRYNNESFVNYDEAMKILGIGNRGKMKMLLNANGIKTQKISNMRVGFLRSEVQGLANRLRNEKEER